MAHTKKGLLEGFDQIIDDYIDKQRNVEGGGAESMEFPRLPSPPRRGSPIQEDYGDPFGADPYTVNVPEGTRTKEGAPFFRGPTGTDPNASVVDEEKGYDVDTLRTQGIYPGGYTSETGEDPFDIQTGEMSREQIKRADPSLYAKLFGTDYKDDPQFSTQAKIRIEMAGLIAYAQAGGQDKDKLNRLETLQRLQVRKDSFGNVMKPVPPRVDGVPSLEERAMIEENLFKNVGGNPYLRNANKELTQYWQANRQKHFEHVTQIRWQDADKLTSQQRSAYMSEFARVSRAKQQEFQADIDQKKEMVKIGLGQFDTERNEAKALAKENRKARREREKAQRPKAITRRTVQQGSAELKAHYTDNVSKVQDKARIGVSSKRYNSVISQPGMTAAEAIETVKRQTEAIMEDYWRNRDTIEKFDRKERKIQRKKLDDGFRRLYGTVPFRR